MSAEETIKAFEEFLANYKQSREEIALRIAIDTKEQTRQRVQARGENKGGSAFAAYTPEYSKQRAKQGYQTARVDYTRTGKLWANVKAVIAGSSPLGVLVEIGPTSPSDIVKVLGPGSVKPRKDGVRRGNPVDPSDKELDEAFAAWAEGVFDLFTKSFN